jgi:hypothetical protein
MQLVAAIGSAKLRSAVTTVIREYIDTSGLIACDDDGVDADPPHHKIADIRDFGFVRDEYPVPREDPLHFGAEDFLVVVDIDGHEIVSERPFNLVE